MRGTKTDHTDVPLWYFLILYCYLKEAGDFDFLFEEEDFMDGGKGTIYNHAKLAVDYSHWLFPNFSRIDEDYIEFVK